MPASNTINGKAFEYACMLAIQEKLREDGKEVSQLATASLNTAESSFYKLSADAQARYMDAARAAARLLFPLEPRLANGSGSVVLVIATDAVAQGPEGDVRDVLMIRMTDDWEIGISCKHNHEALKHPRITEAKDFGRDWVGYPCSNEFLDAMTVAIDPLIRFGENKVKWRNVESKHDLYYVPILQAYLDELVRMCDEHDDVPERLLSYFFGSHDFYKVIMKESAKTTTIEGFNMHGTLNLPCGHIKAITRVARINMPTRLIEARFKEKSKTTIILTFDHGWSISMRLHNKDGIAKPTSLAWDVTLIGLPPETFRNIRAWYE